MSSTENISVVINNGQNITMNKKFFLKTAEVRQLQNKYYKGGRTSFDLIASKKAEAQLDHLIKLINEKI